MVFNATVNNISFISWLSSFIGGGNQRLSIWRKSLTCRMSLTLYHKMMYRVHLARAGFELTTLLEIGTDYICSCKSNYNMIMTTTAPYIHRNRSSGETILIETQFVLFLHDIHFLISVVRRKCWDLKLNILIWMLVVKWKLDKIYSTKRESLSHCL